MTLLDEQSKGLLHEGYVIRRLPKDCFIATPINAICFYEPLETQSGEKYDPIEALERFKNIININVKMQPQSGNVLDNEDSRSNGVRNYTPLPEMPKG